MQRLLNSQKYYAKLGVTFLYLQGDFLLLHIRHQIKSKRKNIIPTKLNCHYKDKLDAGAQHAGEGKFRHRKIPSST
jgi:hypothetical protein